MRQRPDLWVGLDHSHPQLRHAKPRSGPRRPIARADLRDPLPFRDAAFDIVLSVIVLNEIPGPVFRRAVAESARVIRPGGRFVAIVPHPEFLRALDRDGCLRRERGTLSMPGPEGLRLPVHLRSESDMKRILAAAGLDPEFAEVASTPEFVREKPDLRLPPSMCRAILVEARR